MKKSYLAVIFSLLIVLCVSIGGTYLILNKDMFRTYSDGFCLNEKINENMSLTEIAGVYTDSCVTVVVETKSPARHGYQAHGSGVCIASKGYNENANAGSYFATNYHVIEFACDSLYDGYQTQIFIELNSSDTRYAASLLWANKDLDVAVLYSKELNEVPMGWINMKDRVIACDNKDKLRYDEIFIIGTPIDLSYKNTLTLGNISNNSNELVELTGIELYTYFDGGNFKYTPDYAMVKGDYNSYEVVHNVYENVVMVNCDITNGNSGGGVFDKYGNLIGLATLGKDVGSYAMNFIVPIYPIMQVLDKLILANESNSALNIFTMDSMSIVALDANEAYYNSHKTVNNKPIEYTIPVNSTPHYYYDGEFYNRNIYKSAFSFQEEGVYIIKNDGFYSSIPTNFIITGMDKNDLSMVEIKDRNDLIFFLLTCGQGDRINIYGKTSLGLTKSFTITL